MTTTGFDSAIAISDAVRSGFLSAVDVTRTHLARIDLLDGELGAFRAVRHERALLEAAAVDDDPDRASLPLAGVTVAVKDNIAVAGEQVRHGSAATDVRPATHDDELVTRLRRAGAVVIGITRMPELAAWPFGFSIADGVTRNPWNRELDPGGSTGGGAVAVAAGMAALALGTDGGGSLRVPAANCGVVGLKPGRGELPLPGGLAEHWCGLSVSGLIARSAADAALAFAVLQNRPANELQPVRGSLRVAVSTKSPVPTSRPDAHVKAAIDHAVARLTDQGHEVVRANPPYPPTLIQRWSRRWWAGIAIEADSLAVDPSHLEPRTRTLIRKGQRVLRFGGPKPSVATAWQERARHWLSGYDLLLTPTVATAPIKAGAYQGRRYLPTFLAAGRFDPYCQAWNLAGLPAVAVPIGIRDGLPLSVQLIAAPSSGLALLGVAANLQSLDVPPLP